MSDLAHYQPHESPTPTVAVDPTGGRLVAWAESLRAAHTIGQALCGTAFAPQHFRGKPDDAAAAILYGDEIGLTPTAALRSIFVISGAPGLYARSMHALVLSRGHEVWTEEESPSRVTVCGRRRGSAHVEKSTWTIERARTAGYTNNAQYTKNPANMLYARALGDVCRKVAPDVLSGIAYTVEELELDEPEAATTVTRAPAATKRIQRRPPAPPAAEPTFDEPEAEQPASAPEAPADTVTRAQITRLHVLFNAAGITDRDDRLAWLSAHVGRAIGSSNDLTKAEATSAMDALEAEQTTPAEPPLDGWGTQS